MRGPQGCCACCSGRLRRKGASEGPPRRPQPDSARPGLPKTAPWGSWAQLSVRNGHGEARGGAWPDAALLTPVLTPGQPTRHAQGHLLLRAPGAYPVPPARCPPGRGGRRTWQAGALVGGVARGPAGAPVLAGGGAARHVGQLAVRAGVGGAAGAAVGADLVEAGAPVAAGRGVQAALVHVLPAGGAVEAGRAAADVGGLEGQALAAVGTGVGGAGVSLLACLPWWERRVRGALWLPCSPRGLPPGPRRCGAGMGPAASSP